MIFKPYLLFSLFVTNLVNCLQPYLDTSLDFAASPVDFTRLIKLESKLVLKFLVFLTTHSSQDFDLIHLKNYLEDFESTLLTDLDINLELFSKLVTRNIIDFEGLGEDAAKHPFKIYRTIRRFVKDIKILSNKYPNTEISMEIENLQKSQLPMDEDLKIASLSILRLNQLYKLPVENFLTGKLNKRETKCNLSSKNFLEIGKIAVDNNFYSQAVDFFDIALKSWNNKDSDETHDSIRDLLDQAIIKHDRRIKNVDPEDLQPDSGPFFFDDYLRNSRHNSFKNRVPVPFEGLIQDIDLESIDYSYYKDNPKLQNLVSGYRFEKLCRGEHLQHASHLSALRCYISYKSHPTYILRPLKVEIHNEDPLIVQYYDVVNEREINEMKAEVKDEMRISRTIKTTDEEMGQTSRFRTSSNAWITDYKHPTFTYLLQRIGRMIGVNATGWLSTENLQIAAYSPGSHYVPHTDAVFEEGIIDKLAPSEFLRGDRIITFMIYLSDVGIGGATVFPLIKTAVQPVKGSAVVWFNLHSDGSIDRRTLHGGCSVVYGVKWIANKWIRIHDQMFLKKCPVSRSPWGLKI